MLGWVQDVSLQIDTLQFLKFRLKYVKTSRQVKGKKRWKTSKDEIILINYSIVTVSQQLSKVSVRCRL